MSDLQHLSNPPARAGHGAPAEIHGHTVYLIDADPAMRDELGLLLGLRGYRTALFGSAEDFISAWRGHQGGCVVLDAQLPGMDGLSLQRRLAVLGCELPVIVIGSDADFHAARAAFRAHAVDFIPKPIDHARLVAAVEESFQRSEALREHRLRHQEALMRLRELARSERELLGLGLSAPGTGQAAPRPAGMPPAAPRGVPPVAARAEAAADRIVVIEPHALLRMGLEAVLYGAGLGRPVTAASLQEALPALREGGVSLVIADAEYAAAEHCAALRALREVAPAAALMVTAHKMPVGLARACFAAGARGFVEKAVAPDQMAWAVEVMLRGGQFLPEALTAQLAAQAASDAAAPRTTGEGNTETDANAGLARHAGPGAKPDAETREPVPAGGAAALVPAARPAGGPPQATVAAPIVVNSAAGDAGAPPAAIDCSRITGRQRDVARLLAAGLSNKEIARELNISLGTAKNYVAQILSILGAKSRSRAATLMLSHKAVAASVAELTQARGSFMQ
jgi:DNA-binding NarL/FixJ family response regulator